jgi:hypothetical protein
VISHPLYSSNFAPSGYHQFLILKKYLVRKNFETADKKLKTKVTQYLQKEMVVSFNEAGI